MADNWRKLTDNEELVAILAGMQQAAHPQESIKDSVAIAEKILITIIEGGSTLKIQRD